MGAYSPDGDNLREEWYYFMDSNKKLPYEAEKRLQAVIYELENTISDFLGKADFALTELKEGLENDRIGTVRKTVKAEVYAGIAYDYLTQAQSGLTDIILRESREYLHQMKEGRTDER